MTASTMAPVLTLTQIAQMTGGDLIVREVPSEPALREALLRAGVISVGIDSRTLEPGALFVPLPGQNVDGHRFLADAFRRGAIAALCARAAHAAFAGREPGPLVLVDDVTAALQRLARRVRDAWGGPVLGVTGSAGKTTTKDLAAAALATGAPTLKTEGNLNNHWGVPLTLLRLRPEHRAAVVEMAMSAAGEIAYLAAIARPDAGIITNAGSAHLGGEGLGSVAAVAREKAALAAALPEGRPLFAGADSPPLIAALAGMKCRVIRYGLAHDADVRPRALEDLGPEGTRFEVEGFPPVHLRLIGRHQVQNALAALAVAREYRLDPAAVVAALEAERPATGRMQVRRALGATLLVDSYNANPDSTRAALATLAEWPDARRRIAVLGDMLELGPGAGALHRDVGAAVREAELWTVGTHAEDLAAGARGAGVEARVFAELPELAAALRAVLAPGTIVLLKASRGAALERVLTGLELED
ncbi:MAG TPA: UDP-N-acetylmuramoyl-tripeptide--D-alanyl-D-alanine ligase [Candidatus Limnocylindria bacterium]|nr:UDP-N-acetylmuramoyl-tripeptide--D-alanyl-D-alanine ligase [Candidatus Limnocylindria bacterium]